jgi:cystathionine beta-lyase
MGEIDTLLIHGGVDGDSTTGAVNVPIYQTSTYRMTSIDEMPEFAYSRVSNPTRKALETMITQLEHGYAGYAFASGMAAITAALHLFRSGDKLLVTDNVYGGTIRLLDVVFKPFGLTYERIDTSDLALVESKITPDVAGIYIETPANPLLTVTDLAGIAELCQKHGLLSIVDNTFMTPLLQRPLDFGIDIVVHSATKYLGGHSDLLAGLLVVSSPELATRVGLIKTNTGGILDPVDAWLVLRGIKTLSVRMERHQSNARYLVDYLLHRDGVDKVYYPGLEQFPGHEIQKRQADGFGAVISFVLSPRYDLRTFYRSLKLITLGTSLGVWNR